MSGGRIEHLVLAGLAGNKEFGDTVLQHIKPVFFKLQPERAIFERFKSYYTKYNSLPKLNAIQAELEGDQDLGDRVYGEALDLLDTVAGLKDTCDLDWLMDHTEKWCKERLVELNLMDTIQIATGKDKAGRNLEDIPHMLQEAVDYSFKREASVMCAADVQVEEIRPLWWPYLLCGKMHVVASQPNRGKGLFVIDIAARITTGRGWPFSEENAPLGSVIWCEAEDGLADTLVPRAIEAGADLNRLFLFNDPQKFAKLDLAKCIREHDVKLLVMSPAVTFLPGLKDANDEQETREALGRLQKAIDGTDCAVIFIMHPNKKVDTSSIERIMGSRAWTGYPRSVLVLDEEADDPLSKRVMHGKWNNSMKGDDLIFTPVANPEKPRSQFVKVVWSKAESNVNVDDAFDRKKKKGAEEGEKMSAGIWLERYLRGHGETEMGVVLVAGALAGYNRDTLSKAHQRSSIFAFRKEGFPINKSYWSIKGLVPTLTDEAKPMEAPLN